MKYAANGLKGNLIVFVKTNSTNSYLLKIKHDISDKIVSDTIKIYGNRNSSDPNFMKEVIKDSRLLSPAKSYSLVMWSHATSWASPRTLKLKSFGNDDNKEMDVKDFKNAIPSDFVYIMFDACYMGSLEVVYELKEKTKYILASPSEILSSSFPYDLITPHLFGDLEELKIVAKKFIEYYTALSGNSASATVALIDTKELDQLAFYTETLLNSTKVILKFNINILQRLDFESNSRLQAYDFLSFLEHNFKREQYINVKNQLKRAVVFSAHTKAFFNVPIAKFSGLSVYLPTKDDPFKDYYSTLSWYTAAGWYNLFH